MKQTLLQITQDVLSSLSSDEVNSIGDTSESLQVANMVKQKFFDIASRVPLPENEMLLQLDGSGSTTTPILMYVPDGVASIKWIKYFDSTVTGGSAVGYQDVCILPTRSFIDTVTKFNPTETGVASFSLSDQTTGKNFLFYYRNDRRPQFCTIIKNQFVIFDSYIKTIDDTLQTSKTMAFGQMNPVFLMEDGFIPDLADEQFPLLLNEVKALAFFELKQQPHQLAMQETKRGWSNIQKNKAVTNRPTYFDEIPNFGRFGRGSYGVPSYFKLRGFDRP